jgi:hypothetical protein
LRNKLREYRTARVVLADGQTLPSAADSVGRMGGGLGAEGASARPSHSEGRNGVDGDDEEQAA